MVKVRRQPDNLAVAGIAFQRGSEMVNGFTGGIDTIVATRASIRS